SPAHRTGRASASSRAPGTCRTSRQPRRGTGRSCRSCWMERTRLYSPSLGEGEETGSMDVTLSRKAKAIILVGVVVAAAPLYFASNAGMDRICGNLWTKADEAKTPEQLWH